MSLFWDFAAIVFVLVTCLLWFNLVFQFVSWWVKAFKDDGML